MKNLILTLATTACIALPAMAEEKKIEITGNDAMQFSTKAIEVTAGDKVVLTLKHIGKLPKLSMGHNFVLLKSDAKVMDFAVVAMKATTTEYIPAEDPGKSMVITHTKVVGGGESDTITFDAPAAGTYPYLCSFPGHFSLMQGVLTVKAK